MPLNIKSPFSFFTDSKGNPLNNGYIYIGNENQNPVTNPKAVYYDNTYTTPAQNPVRTTSGYIYNNGTPAKLYTEGTYSIVIMTSDGGLVYSSLSEESDISADDIYFIQDGVGAVRRTVESKLKESISIFDFMSRVDVQRIRSGATDVNCTQAMINAHATGRLIYYPYGFYNFYGYFPECEGGLVGEGWSTNNASKRVVISFYNCIDTTRAAIKVKEGSPKSRYFRISNIYFVASSWNVSTGCLGYGLEATEGAVIVENVAIQGFKKSNIYLHHSVASNGPYESVFKNVASYYSGEHGIIIGAGANVITLINVESKWSGCASFGVAPSSPSTWDGLLVTASSPGVTSYTPESLCVIGGDFSYNSRYGTNLNNLTASSCVMPGYAEGNLVKEARFGNIVACNVNYAQVAGGVSGILNEMNYAPCFITTKVLYAGKQIAPLDDYSFVQNPALQDLGVGDVYINAPVRNAFLSRTDNFGSFIRMRSNDTPDGTAINKATETALSLIPSGTAAMGFGSGSHFLKISQNNVRIPAQFTRAVSSGWSSSFNFHIVADTAPGSGVWTRGDRVDIYTNAVAGGSIGFVCTASGTPGTWKSFGAISV